MVAQAAKRSEPGIFSDGVLRGLLRLREASVLLVAVIVALIFTALKSDFLGSDAQVVLALTAQYGFFAVGEAMLMITGEIDLSAAKIYSTTPFIAYYLTQANVPFLPAVVLALVGAGLIGMVNGIVTVRLGVPSLIATLGMLFLLNGITLTVSQSHPVTTPMAEPLNTILGHGQQDLTIGGPAPYAGFIWLVLLVGVLTVVLRRTRFGLHTISVGSNLLAAREIGIHTDRTKILNFVIMGLMAGFGGLVQAIASGSTDPSAGDPTLSLYGIAAAVIGGTSLFGGSGTIIGALIGCDGYRGHPCDRDSISVARMTTVAITGFREYLRAHPCDEARGIDLETFDYGRFLRERGYTDMDLLAAQRDRRMLLPLYRRFIAYNVAEMEGNVAEIAAHAKGYAREKRGEEIPVTANLFNCLPHAGSIRKYCDIIVGENSGIKLRQDGFYRFGVAFLGGKEGCFIEDPDDYILRVVEDIKNGKNDTYILLMLEPLAQGFNMAVPYGAWLMNLAKDSFYPDLDLERRMGRWLTEHEHLFPRQPVAETALLYDLRSALETELFLGGHADRERDGGFRTFHDLAQLLCDHHVLYNVLYVGDDEPLTGERLAGYKKLIIPDALSLPDGEVGAIEGWIAHGGKAVAVGKADRRLYGISRVYHRASAFLDWVKEGGQIVDAEDIAEIGVGLHRRGVGYVLHLVNYNLNSISREIETVPTMEFTLSWTPEQVRVHSFPASQVKATLEGAVLTVENMGIYTIVDLQ